MLCLLAAGCTEQKELSVDVDAMAKELAQQVRYQDEIALVGDEMANMVYDMPEGIDKAVIYMGSGATAEEVSVFEAKDKESAEKMLDAARAHLQKQRDAFESYIPEEVKKLDQAVVKQKGRYVAVCVTDDIENAKKVMDEYLK